MIFGKKKSLIRGLFEKTFDSIPVNFKDRFVFLIIFYDFCFKAINENIIRMLENDFKNKFMEHEKDVIYHFVLKSFKLDDFENQSILKISSGGIEFYINIILMCFMNRNISVIDDASEIQNLKNSLEIAVEKNQSIAFSQMLTKIYSLRGKEYNMQDFENFKQTYEEFVNITTSLWSGVIEGFNRTDKKLAYSKCKQIINDLPDGVLCALNTPIIGFVLAYNQRQNG